MCCRKPPLNQKAELIELLPRQDSLQAFFSLDRLAQAVLFSSSLSLGSVQRSSPVQNATLWRSRLTHRSNLDYFFHRGVFFALEKRHDLLFSSLTT